MLSAQPRPRTVGGLISKQAVTCPAVLSIVEAARRMAAADTGSIVAVDDEHRPVGILTDSDLRRKVVAVGLPGETPLARVMSQPVVQISPHTLDVEAVQTMLERRIHHLVVVDDGGRTVSVLADSDLLAAEARRPLYLARRIERATSVEDLAAAKAVFPRTAAQLLDAGATARHGGQILAETNDRVVRRLLDLYQAEHGPAPVPYCWLALGSEGRREQTPLTDQDHGLVYADGGDAGAAAYFARLSAWMTDALERCGAPRCKGGVMASNPGWRGPLNVWLERFDGWLHERHPEALLNALIGFDFRPVVGETGLANTLRDWLRDRTPLAQRFLGHLAAAALQAPAPLDFLGRIRVERRGGESASLDLKLAAVRPIVDAMRLLALQHGIPETNSFERLAAIAELGGMPEEDARDVQAALEAFQFLRLRRQVDDLLSGRATSNRLVRGQLNRADRARLREHLRTVEHLRGELHVRYGLLVRAS